MQILSYFDTWLKIDDDVEFHKPMLLDIGVRLVQEKALFMHTGGMHDAPECQAGEHNFIHGYLDTESQRCGRLVHAAAEGQPWFQQVDTWMWHGNFVGGALGFFTSPEQLAFAQAFHNAPGNHIFRWQEQGFWPATLGVFTNGSQMLDLEYLREEHYFCHGQCGNETGGP